MHPFIMHYERHYSMNNFVFFLFFILVSNFFLNLLFNMLFMIFNVLLFSFLCTLLRIQGFFFLSNFKLNQRPSNKIKSKFVAYKITKRKGTKIKKNNRDFLSNSSEINLFFSGTFLLSLFWSLQFQDFTLGTKLYFIIIRKSKRCWKTTISIHRKTKRDFFGLLKINQIASYWS